MKTYARIENGRLAEIIAGMADEEGNEIPVELRFHPDFVATFVDITDVSPAPEVGWVTNDGKTFAQISLPQLTPDEVEDAKVCRVQAHLDQAAQCRGYDNIASAVSYADEPSVPKFQAEGQAFRAWRSLVWEKCHEILDAVKSGEAQIPTDDALIAALPHITLPEA